jgi:hypothetical protein
VTESTLAHRHGRRIHAHAYAGVHRHLLSPKASRPLLSAHEDEHGHSHGLVDRSIVRSRAGIRAVALSLAILAVTAVLQVAIFLLSDSVALLADVIHNFGDALTAVPLAIAFLLRSGRAERLAGLAVAPVPRRRGLRAVRLAPYLGVEPPDSYLAVGFDEAASLFGSVSRASATASSSVKARPSARLRSNSGPASS